MKLDIVAGSKNDEFYTPEYAITPILKYVKDYSKVWCPFDTKESLFVKKLREKGVLVRHFDAPRIGSWLRITIGTPDEMRALLKALDEILEV